MSAATDWFAAIREAFAAIDRDQALVVLLPLHWPDPPGGKNCPEEIARMARFRRPEDARAHGLGRLLARHILGLGIADAPFLVTARGKPYHDTAPSFSISHAGGMVAVAVAKHGEIGVDIECRALGWNPMTLADRVCHPREAIWLDSLPDAQKLEGFMAIWTRKEALLKAEGSGLVDNLAAIDTGPQTTRGYTSAARRFDLWTLPSPQIACAAAVEPCVAKITLMLAGQQPIICDRT